MDFTIYNLTNGQVEEVVLGAVDESDVTYDDQTQGFVSGLYEGDLYYIPGGFPTSRPLNDILVDVTNVFLGDKITFRNTDIGGVFKISPQSNNTLNVYSEITEEFEITDTTIEFQPDKVGEFLIEIEETWPTRDYDVIVTVRKE